MANEKHLIVDGAGTLRTDVVDQTPITAAFDINPRLIDITLKREPTFPDLDFKLLREKPRRDWEQRQKKRRK